MGDILSKLNNRNKCDLETEREVSKEEGGDSATSFKCPFFEASAKKEININESFHALLREILNFKKTSPANSVKPKTKKCCLL